MPPHIDDKSLKKIMLKFADDSTAKITESKVMKDYKKSGGASSKGSVGASKGYGFVAYTTHEAALNALRKLNNNPSVFSKEQRPIVEFSIENRNALNARQKRLEKSREKNPLWKGNKLQKSSVIPKHERPERKEEIEEKPSFVGSLNNPKQKNLPSHEGPKVRHKRTETRITRRDLKKKEKEKRNPKKRKINENESTHAPNASSAPEPKRPKIEGKETGQKKDKKLSRKQAKKLKNQKNDIKDEKQFASLVANYKSKLINNDGIAVRNKWFA